MVPKAILMSKSDVLAKKFSISNQSEVEMLSINVAVARLFITWCYQVHAALKAGFLTMQYR